MHLTEEKGASSWFKFSILSIDEYNFYQVIKGASHDAVALHYGWPLSNFPISCVCGRDIPVGMLSGTPGKDSNLKCIMICKMI